MTKLKLSAVQDEKPVKLFVTLPAALHRDLVAYAEILAHESGQKVEPAQLIAPMLERFIASDRGFRKARGEDRNPSPKPSTTSVKSFLATLSAQD
jgi:hypothetical protein